MRVKLELPSHFFALFNIPIRITDINYGNHTGNDAIVSILHEARMQWLAKYNFTELNIEGIGLIMADLAVEFKNESFYGDIVEVALGAGEITKVSFELYYKLTVNGNRNVIVAKAKSGMVCYDYTMKKVVAVPQTLKNILSS